MILLFTPDTYGGFGPELGMAQESPDPPADRLNAPSGCCGVQAQMGGAGVVGGADPKALSQFSPFPYI